MGDKWWGGGKKREEIMVGNRGKGKGGKKG